MASGIDVGAGLDQRVEHLTAADAGNHRRVERGEGLIDFRLHLWIALQQLAEQSAVIFFEGLLEMFHRIS
jgi:hypothetical protein